MEYCAEKQKWCNNTTEFGYCNTTACINHDNYATISVTKTEAKLGRACEVCGSGTESLDFYLCKECRDRLKRILYPEKLNLKREDWC